MKRTYFLLALISFIWPILSNAQTIGPENGVCMIIGGGRLDSTIINKFMREAGGPEARIVVIPTAISDDPVDENGGFADLEKRFERWGFLNIEVLHSTDHNVANSDEFAGRISVADGVWFTGGRQWRLVDAYAGTKTEEAFHQVLAKGGVIAGSSAGATIQGSYLARGDSKTNTIMMGDHQEGFGFIKNIAIDQHVIARNRQFDLFEIMQAHPELLGVGLDENTALVVKGKYAKVIGSSYVLMYDSKKWDGRINRFVESSAGEDVFYFLRPGQLYDLELRKVVSE